MNELFICDTPFQILNALNIAYHQSDSGKGKYRTLYIINQFNNAQLIYERILNSNLFDKVYLLTRDETKFLKVGFKRNIRMAFDFLAPKLFLAKRFYNYDISDIIYNDFDIVYASGAFSTVAAILKINRKAEFILFDDGLGSYSGNIIIRSSGGRLNRIFCVLFRVGSSICIPSKLLVNNPSFCYSTAVDKKRVFQLPSFDAKFISFCNSIFETNINKDASIYWLTQPIDCNQGSHRVRSVVRDIIEPYKSKIIIRLHPRDMDRDFYSLYNIETSEDLWELSILNKNIDQLVLISEFSSAQIMPKLLFDIEPTLVFLYRFNSEYSEIQRQNIEIQINSLKEKYVNKNKIYTPENKEQLEELMKKFFV